METIKFGPGQKMQLTEPLDTWLSAGLRDFAVPEAIGSSARVFRLKYPNLAGAYADNPAIKIMRPDKTSYALPLFENEARILDRVKDIPGVTGLLGLGFLQVESGQWPDEIAPLTKSLEEKASAAQISGNAEFFTPDEVPDFLEQLENRVSAGWLAFLVLPHRWEDNLYLRCDSGYTRGDFHRTFPIINALEAAFQISQILQAAHDRKVVYLDHKVLHYYWNEPRQQVFILDWNIGRLINNENSAEVYEFDVLQFSARALHHLLTGRQAPGSVKIGPNRPEDIQNAPHHYDPIWTYDDQKRLSQNELDFLTRAIQGQHQTAKDLGEDLKKLIEQRGSKTDFSQTER
jgi:serine/threonine protein kinase